MSALVGACRWADVRGGVVRRTFDAGITGGVDGVGDARSSILRRMPRPGVRVAASACVVGRGPRRQRQSTAIATLATVPIPISQKMAAGTAWVRFWRAEPMPSSAPITSRMTSLTAIFV